MANSSMLVLPIITIPALFNFSTTVASYGAIKLSSIFDPQEVFTPSVQKMSFCAIGIPVSGPAFPWLIFSSASFACTSAAIFFLCMNRRFFRLQTSLVLFYDLGHKVMAILHGRRNLLKVIFLIVFCNFIRSQSCGDFQGMCHGLNFPCFDLIHLFYKIKNIGQIPGIIRNVLL